MIEGVGILTGIIHSVPVCVISGPFLWILLLLIFTLGVIAASILLFVFTEKLEDWKHESIISDAYVSGGLKDLAESLKLATVDYSGNAPVKKLINKLFYQKMQSIHGLSPEEMDALTAKDKRVLEEMIQDKEIIDWLHNVPPQNARASFLAVLPQQRKERKEQYLQDIHAVLDKMEGWRE